VQLDLYWIPLGAGTPVVRASGRIFEFVAASVHRRPRCDIYHAALIATTAHRTIAVEMAPIPDRNGREARGVVAEGAVGSGWLGRWRVFRYEIRCWENGVIPDLSDAVASPIRLSDDSGVARRVLATLPSVPTPVWGRDELEAGEMWNSNSVVSWTLSSAGVNPAAIPLPPGGRAPGWDAGCRVAARTAAV
jgi:hypothetical protein